MADAEVVVTGMGMVTPLGTAAASSVAAWQGGKNAHCRSLPELAGTSLEKFQVATLPELDPATRLGGRRMLKYMSAAAVLGCIAAREATSDADIRRRFPPERIGLYAGTGLAAASVDEVLPMIQASLDESGCLSCRLLGERGLATTNPLLSFKILANMPPCLISILESIKGPNYIFTPWEGQTGAALLEAWMAVAQGEVDCALTGAADNAAHPATLVYLIQAGLLDAEEYPAAGAAYLVLERAETAEKDGQKIYARIRDMKLEDSEIFAPDPLSYRMGRSFSAAPAILLALACQGAFEQISISGRDRQRFSAKIRTAV